MRSETVRALNSVNSRFYRERAEEFDETRSRPWKGWSEIYDRFGTAWTRDLSVLDVGCGNARFATFLSERGRTFSYVGVDASPRALTFARARLDAIGFAQAKLVRCDFVLEPESLSESIEPLRFDLIALFGVLHHVPGCDRRSQLVEQLARSLDLSGQLVISLWQFLYFDRFRKKRIPWSEFESVTGTKLDVTDLEKGDAAITWGADTQSVRFCHHVDRVEALELVRHSGLTSVSEFEGENGMNRYLVLQRTD